MEKLDDLEKRIEILKKIKIIETSGEITEGENPIAFGHLRIIIKDAYEIFPKEKPIFDNLTSIYNYHNIKYTYLKQVNQFLSYLSSLVKESKDSENPNESEEKIFLDAKERIQKANKH